MSPPTADERHGARPPAVRIATFCFLWLTLNDSSGIRAGSYEIQRETQTKIRPRTPAPSATRRATTGGPLIARFVDGHWVRTRGPSVSVPPSHASPISTQPP